MSMQAILVFRQPTLAELRQACGHPIAGEGWYEMAGGEGWMLVYQEPGMWRALVWRDDPRPLLRRVLELREFPIPA